MFSQLLDFIDKDVFLRITNRYEGNRYVKNFTCWNQSAVMMFGQLSNRESASRSTLADANNKRDYHICEEFAYRVVADARKCRATDIFKLGRNVYAFDSTTIKLCPETFKWAIFRKHQRKGGIKVHT